ncbi:MAG TPA: ATP-binding protein [Pyrinomonadaceae bacterium]|nr:ATP-binding protein [Pyrinomonadaceae bacterium]
MFRQANTAASRVQAGMGFGLAVVQQLINLHQGTITSDGPGKGAKFTIELPSSMEQQTRPTPVVTRITPLDQLAVLLVDDSEDTQN